MCNGYLRSLATYLLLCVGRSIMVVQGKSAGWTWALADCASIIFGIIEAKKNNLIFLNEHCHGIISKF